MNLICYSSFKNADIIFGLEQSEDIEISVFLRINMI